MNKGFTLIELIIVIVILGILAVVAAPKFMGISSDARKANLAQLASTLQTSAKLAHTKAILAGKDNTSAIIKIAGNDVRMAQGYPTATTDGIVQVITDANEWHPIVPSIKILGGLHKSVTGLMMFSQYPINKMSATEAFNTQCFVLYTDLSTAAEAQPDSSSNHNSNSHDLGLIKKTLCYLLSWVGADQYIGFCRKPNDNNGKESGTQIDKNFGTDGPEISIVSKGC
ncbi:prepilin-type N-terminal cleavage/methylation domain-containing protein [Photobacterium toruni]|uniref:prepilin-type N-terminal cleavage/methylation domain-containing protein n=1 Tax=Photobacterium toruni TaxID=1935446 RepID=UPI002737FD53|nr:prepilin-type N-terminal cleavage/methylation domain-containing protein [Photobacterium toruni]MEC6814310.1 prepilin-type N-terminal cleavage/methylation domain-containing protein [Photobacterium toruni]